METKTAQAKAHFVNVLCLYQILKSPPVRFDSKTLCVPAYSGTFGFCVSIKRFCQCLTGSTDDLCLVIDSILSGLLLYSTPVEKLHSLNDGQWTLFILQLCSSLEDQNPSTPPSSTATRSRLNLLCYLCCVVGHKVIANRLINSTLVGKCVFT